MNLNYFALLGLMLGSVSWSQDLAQIYSSRTPQQLQERKIANYQTALQTRTCTIQLQLRRVPWACVKKISRQQMDRACERVQTVSATSIELVQALKSKNWQKPCRQHLKRLLQRKIYQESEHQFGVDFEIQKTYANSQSFASGL